MLEDFRINIFLSVCRSGSFTRAAEEMGISQPAVSQNVAELERLLDAKLFDRNRRELVLTDDGRIFYEYAEKISYWYKAADSLFSRLPKMGFKDRITISVSEDILPSLSKVLSVFMAGNQNLRVSVIGYDRSVEEDKALSEGIDLSIFSEILTDELQWSSEEYDLLDSQLVAFVSSSSSHAFNQQGAVSEESLKANLICPDYMTLPLWLRSSVRMQTSSIPQIVRMVSDSVQFIGIAPFFAIKEHLESSSIKILPIPQLAATVRVKFVPSGQFASTAFCAVLRQKLTAVLSV